MAGLKVSILGPQIGKNWGFLLLKCFRGTCEPPYRRWNISGHAASCGKVSQKSVQGRWKSVVGNKKR